MSNEEVEEQIAMLAALLGIPVCTSGAPKSAWIWEYYDPRDDGTYVAFGKRGLGNMSRGIYYFSAISHMDEEEHHVNTEDTNVLLQEIKQWME